MSKRKSLNDRINDDDNKMAKAVSALTSINNDININNDNNESVDDYVNVNVNIDNDNDEAIDSNDYINDDTDNSIDDAVNANVTRIIIEKPEKVEITKRATYYLLPETIKKIEKLSKATGVGKSALVQRLLDQALDLVEIK